MGISIWQLLIVLAIVLLLFGAKRLRNIGSDLGTAVKGFKTSMKEEPEAGADKDADAGQPGKLEDPKQDRVIEGEATREDSKERS